MEKMYRHGATERDWNLMTATANHAGPSRPNGIMDITGSNRRANVARSRESPYVTGSPAAQPAKAHRGLGTAGRVPVEQVAADKASAQRRSQTVPAGAATKHATATGSLAPVPANNFYNTCTGAPNNSSTSGRKPRSALKERPTEDSSSLFGPAEENGSNRHLVGHSRSASPAKRQYGITPLNPVDVDDSEIEEEEEPIEELAPRSAVRGTASRSTSPNKAAATRASPVRQPGKSSRAVGETVVKGTEQDVLPIGRTNGELRTRQGLHRAAPSRTGDRPSPYTPGPSRQSVESSNLAPTRPLINKAYLLFCEGMALGLNLRHVDYCREPTEEFIDCVGAMEPFKLSFNDIEQIEYADGTDACMVVTLFDKQTQTRESILKLERVKPVSGFCVGKLRLYVTFALGQTNGLFQHFTSSQLRDRLRPLKPRAARTLASGAPSWAENLRQQMAQPAADTTSPRQRTGVVRGAKGSRGAHDDESHPEYIADSSDGEAVGQSRPYTMPRQKPMRSKDGKEQGPVTSSDKGRKGKEAAKEPAVERGQRTIKDCLPDTNVAPTRQSRRQQQRSEKRYAEVNSSDDESAMVLAPGQPVLSTFQPQIPRPQNPDAVLFPYPLHGPARVTVTEGDRYRMLSGDFLNDTLLEFALRHVISEAARTSKDPDFDVGKDVHLFTSFFYERLSKSQADLGKHHTDENGDWLPYRSVQKWTKAVDVFEKKLIIVPINENAHWWLTVIYNPAGILQSETEKDVPRDEPSRPSSAQGAEESEDTGEAEENEPVENPKRAAARLQDAESARTSTSRHASPMSGRNPRMSSPSSPDPIARGRRSSPDPLDSINRDSHEPTDGSSRESFMPKGPADPAVLQTADRLAETSLASESAEEDVDMERTHEAQSSQAASMGRQTGAATDPGKPIVMPCLTYFGSGSSKAQPALANVDEVASSFANDVAVAETPPGSASVSYDETMKKLSKEIYTSGQTHIITLDSLGGSHAAVGRTLGFWLQMEARTRKGSSREMGKIPVREAHVPEQPNYSDCGLYLVHFVERLLLDMKDALRMIAIKKGDAKRHKTHGDAYLKDFARVWDQPATMNLRETWTAKIDSLTETYRKARGENVPAATTDDAGAQAAGASQNEEDEIVFYDQSGAAVPPLHQPAPLQPIDPTSTRPRSKQKPPPSVATHAGTKASEDPFDLSIASSSGLDRLESAQLGGKEGAEPSDPSVLNGGRPGGSPGGSVKRPRASEERDAQTRQPQSSTPTLAQAPVSQPFIGPLLPQDGQPQTPTLDAVAASAHSPEPVASAIPHIAVPAAPDPPASPSAREESSTSRRHHYDGLGFNAFAPIPPTLGYLDPDERAIRCASAEISSADGAETAEPGLQEASDNASDTPSPLRTRRGQMHSVRRDNGEEGKETSAGGGSSRSGAQMSSPMFPRNDPEGGPSDGGLSRPEHDLRIQQSRTAEADRDAGPASARDTESGLLSRKRSADGSAQSADAARAPKLLSGPPKTAVLLSSFGKSRSPPSSPIAPSTSDNEVSNNDPGPGPGHRLPSRKLKAPQLPTVNTTLDATQAIMSVDNCFLGQSVAQVRQIFEAGAGEQSRPGKQSTTQLPLVYPQHCAPASPESYDPRSALSNQKPKRSASPQDSRAARKKRRPHEHATENRNMSSKEIFDYHGVDVGDVVSIGDVKRHDPEYANGASYNHNGGPGRQAPPIDVTAVEATAEKRNRGIHRLGPGRRFTQPGQADGKRINSDVHREISAPTASNGHSGSQFRSGTSASPQHGTSTDQYGDSGGRPTSSSHPSASRQDHGRRGDPVSISEARYHQLFKPALPPLAREPENAFEADSPNGASPAEIPPASQASAAAYIDLDLASNQEAGRRKRPSAQLQKRPPTPGIITTARASPDEFSHRSGRHHSPPSVGPRHPAGQERRERSPSASPSDRKAKKRKANSAAQPASASNYGLRSQRSSPDKLANTTSDLARGNDGRSAANAVEVLTDDEAGVASGPQASKTPKRSRIGPETGGASSSTKKARGRKKGPDGKKKVIDRKGGTLDGHFSRPPKGNKTAKGATADDAIDAD